MKTVIAGLGNPGEEYGETYHNAGALALLAIADAHAPEGGKLVFKAHRGLFRYATQGDAAFVLPLTFMNGSGTAVKEALKKFGASAENLILIHDESDLPLGDYQISAGKNSAGHKGVQSVIDALGTNEFTRVRVGIRDPKEKLREKAESFVLRPVSAGDKKKLEEVFRRLARELAF